MDETDLRKAQKDTERRNVAIRRHGGEPYPIWPAREYPWAVGALDSEQFQKLVLMPDE
jgi:hypothetical protein